MRHRHVDCDRVLDVYARELDDGNWIVTHACKVHGFETTQHANNPRGTYQYRAHGQFQKGSFATGDWTDWHTVGSDKSDLHIVSRRPQ